MISMRKASARELTHARILLKADQGPEGPGWSDKQIQQALEVSASTVQRVRKSCAQYGVQEVILPQASSRMRRRRLDGRQEARLIALVCSAPPDASALCTLRRLSSTLVELGYEESISHETVRQVLLANQLKPWIKKQWWSTARIWFHCIHAMLPISLSHLAPDWSADWKRPGR
jgi:transposase